MIPLSPSSHTWFFPLRRSHAGVPLGNGRMGVLVWGEKNRLYLTLGRSDFWDHRSGKEWKPEMNFRDLRKILESNDEPAIRSIFANVKEEGLPSFPSVVPIGKIELCFPENILLREVVLNFETAIATVKYHDSSSEHSLSIEVCLEKPLLEISFSNGSPIPQISGIPAWENVAQQMESTSFPKPEFFSGNISGWKQATPSDASVTVGWKPHPEGFRVAVVLKENLDDTLEGSLAGNAAWWKNFWSRVPRISTPDERYRFLFSYGLYKFATLTHPDGVPATLQGPWVEEYQFPPWSNDYHFNINVQLCYGPAYAAGLPEHLVPLFEMIKEWLPKLRENARLFVGIDDGYLLPHAVDDRCAIIGAFWTGTIDHACTAWIAKMMHDYWRHTGDDVFLRDFAYPFMKGAMRVYEEMLDRKSDGSLCFPVSVSPEYRGANMNAWGVNASFQLAACHTLLDCLFSAADFLKESPRPIWNEMREKLPLASVVNDPVSNTPVIALWDGLHLEESHRHHSHLAGICPFDIFDFDDPKWNPILKNSVIQWLKMGMGAWTGWCIPWAAMIHHRLGNAEFSNALIHYWESIYTNFGHGTLHDPQLSNPQLKGEQGDFFSFEKRPEIMQMDAGMGALTAVMDAFLLSRRGVHYLFQGAPEVWRNCSFENICAEGGFRVSATRGPAGVERVEIRASRPGKFLLANPWPNDSRGSVLTLELQAGQVVELMPCVVTSQ